MPQIRTSQIIRFATFEVDLQAQELRKGGLKLKLTGQPFQVLAILLEQPGTIVTREELQKRLWPDTFVDVDHNLNTAINKIREALGDSAESPRFVETLPRRGYRFLATADLVAVGPISPASTKVKLPFKNWKLLSAIAAFVAVCAIAAGLVFWVPSQRRALSSPPVHPKTPIPLTGSFWGESDPAVSPDGERVAYVAQDENQRNFNVYVKLIGAGPPLRLTSNAEQERFPTWSPDGHYIAFLRNTVKGNDVYIIPALGGPERKLTEAASYDCTLSWSSDGELLAIADQTSPKEPISIFLVSVGDGSKRKATRPPPDSMGDVYPAFSPDGHSLAFMRVASRTSTGMDGDLYLQKIAGDAMPETVARRLTFDNAHLAGFDWTADGRNIVLSSGRFGSLRLWRLGLDGKLAPLTEPSENAVFPSISRRGGRLAYRHDPAILHGTDLISHQFIYRLKLSSPAKGQGAAVRFCPSSSSEVSPQFSPDGTRVVFSSGRSGSGELWVCNNDGSGVTQLTSLGGYSGSPEWSADGQKVVFDHIVTGAGSWEVMVASVEQVLPLRVSSRIANGSRPSWSKDGKWVYFASEDPNKMSQIWRIPAQGGTALQVTKLGGSEPRESPDGKSVYYTKDSSPGIWTVPVGGGEETRRLSQGYSGFWAISARGIYLLVPSSSGAPAVKFFDFTTQRMTQLTLLPADTRLNLAMPGFTMSPDTETIMYVQTVPPGNVMVVELSF